MVDQPLSPLIRTHHTHIPSPLPSSPSFQLHLTRLTDTLFIWVGAAPPTPVSLQEIRSGAAAGAAASSAGSQDQESKGITGLSLDDNEDEAPLGAGDKRVTLDWAVTMPVRPKMPTASTPLFRSATADLAEPMSQRIARKFSSNQVHLSLSLPPTLTAPSGPALDPFASKTLLIMEKELGKWVAEVLAGEKTAP